MRIYKQQFNSGNIAARLTPGCKINLGLTVQARLESGYHQIETVLYPLAWPCDELMISHSSKPGLSLLGDACGVAQSANLIAQAYSKFANKTGLQPGIIVRLTKRIPLGSGLGGGSADAAAFLQWLNGFADNILPKADLAKICFELGADVPFFLLKEAARATGIGEKLKALPLDCANNWLVLVNPGIHIETKWAFSAWDSLNILTKKRQPITNFASDRLGQLDLSNDLEQVVFGRWPKLAEVKRTLLEYGAWASAMSGSGSSFYGIYNDAGRAAAAAKALRKKWSLVYLQKMRNFGM